MANFPSHPDTDDSGTGPGLRASGGRARWKLVEWIVIPVILLALFIVLHLAGVFGPGQH